MRVRGPLGILFAGLAFIMVLYVPPSLRRFTPRRVVPSASSRYMALEYDLVEALRPKLSVVLGAGDCVSFFTYCQSMDEHDVDGTCYAVDEWTNTEGVHPQGSFDAINAHARKFYPGLTYLVKMAPGEALRHFDEETIDLLRVDGSRPEVMPGSDVEAWHRRVRPGGVIVWHGTSAPNGSWPLVAERGPSVTFFEGAGGLGLAWKPGADPKCELLRLVFVERHGADLERLYAHAHEYLEFKRLLLAVGGA